MAYIDDYFETSDSGKVRVRVPSSQGGADRTVYVNGRDSNYYLGDSNDRVYFHGREVAKTLKDFIKIKFWGG